MKKKKKQIVLDISSDEENKKTEEKKKRIVLDISSDEENKKTEEKKKQIVLDISSDEENEEKEKSHVENAQIQTEIIVEELKERKRINLFKQIFEKNEKIRKVYFMKKDYTKIIEERVFNYSKYNYKDYYAVIIRDKKGSKNRANLEKLINEKKIDIISNSSLRYMDLISFGEKNWRIFTQKMCYIMPIKKKKTESGVIEIYKKIVNETNVNKLVQNYFEVLTIFADNHIFFSDFKLDNIGFTEDFKIVFFDKENRSDKELKSFGDDAIRLAGDIYDYFKIPNQYRYNKGYGKFEKANDLKS